MKKNYIIIIINIIIIYLLFININTLSITVINTSITFLTKLLPTLLPFFIISKILINYNISYYISKLFNNNIYIYIFIISLISGAPSNAINIKELYQKNIITLNEANKYIKCSFFSNPLFLYTMLSQIFSIKLTILIIITHYIANIIIYLFKPIKTNNNIKKKKKSFNKILIDAIKTSSITILNIYITIILFNIIINILPNYLNNFKGLIEISYGLNYLNNININIIYKLILAIIYISFGGISIIIQVYEVLSETNINISNFIVSRFYQIIISLTISMMIILGYNFLYK